MLLCCWIKKSQQEKINKDIYKLLYCLDMWSQLHPGPNLDTQKHLRKDDRQTATSLRRGKVSQASNSTTFTLEIFLIFY